MTIMTNTIDALPASVLHFGWHRPLYWLSFGMVALVASIAAIFYLGILPSRVLTLAAQSISTIF